MARDNPTWGQARIAAELLLKLGIQVSPRTVQKYLLEDPNAGRRQAVPISALDDLCPQSCPRHAGL